MTDRKQGAGLSSGSSAAVHETHWNHDYGLLVPSSWFHQLYSLFPLIHLLLPLVHYHRCSDLPLSDLPLPLPLLFYLPSTTPSMRSSICICNRDSYYPSTKFPSDYHLFKHLRLLLQNLLINIVTLTTCLTPVPSVTAL